MTREERIRIMAYYEYEDRCRNGEPLDEKEDWYIAEAKLQAQETLSSYPGGVDGEDHRVPRRYY